MLSAAQRALSDLKPELGTTRPNPFFPVSPSLFQCLGAPPMPGDQPSGSFAVLDARNLLP